nr:sugar ABC transporter permease [uncultured Sellimonas sp.]
MKKVRLGTRLVFILPALIWFCAAIILPVIISIYYSFFDWDGISEKIFVGLQNYKEMINDKIVWKALINSLKMAFWSVVFQLPIGMFFAIVLCNKKIKGRNFFRTAYFLPVVLSSALIGILWTQIYDPNYGLINSFLDKLGLEEFKQLWLGDMKLSLGCVIVAVIWQFIGNYVLIYYMALHDVSEDVIESARLDGVNPLQMFFKIQLPLIWPVIRLTLILAVVNSLKYFDLVYIMTGGGPNSSSEVLATYVMRNGFNSMRMGYANTVAVLLLFLGIFFVVLFNKILAPKQESN